MSLTRRAFLARCASLPLATTLPHRSVAELPLGPATLTTVSDGHLVLPRSFLFSHMPDEELTSILQDFDVPDGHLTPDCNLALYRDGTNTVLFDVGAGPDFMPSAGAVQDSLAAVELTPDDITHVLFTHAHPDHIWGLLDEFDDPVFASAHMMMGRAEWDYWWDPRTVDTIAEDRMSFAVGARRRMQTIEAGVTLFEDGEEILPGIAAVATPGHTPGHMSFELRNGPDAAMVVGDAIGNHHVAFRRPDWRSGSDQDMDQAAETRRMLLDRLSREKMQLVGFHLPGGGIGRAEATEDGYHFLQDET
ncbi:MBL fold metallo-hydrolase [Roseobacter sinensis]|uniref:MBL fold metallo-hydrolase n=1 Tax=Roseobacter sinensis TaxID=2931391 RepID=A0ABT3BGU5_9RHOB|nr:MBL fold metallo-hydrolase [Roseobacter sp. WL0113]MCV3272788.1 MBL fold metallo-hydrolase [Roseobacter sp. WL0113]